MEGNNNPYQQYQPNNCKSNSYSNNKAMINNFGINADSNMEINSTTRSNNNSNTGNSWNYAAASVSTNNEYSSDQIAAMSTGLSLAHKVSGYGSVGSSDETTNTNIDIDLGYVADPTTVSSGPVQMLIDSEAAERAWARELYEMSSDTREAINYELHGVASRAVPEDPAVLAEALILLQIEIETRIPPIHKQGHTRAVMGLKSNYVQTPEFRLRFLRAERFDIKKAAIRYCRGLDYLVVSFGEQALLRQLYLSDLSKEEERFLKKGLKQILPTRDRFGRRLMAHFGSYSDEYPFHLRAKVVTYLCFGVLAEDVTTQRNGVVSLGFFSEGDNDLLAMERKGFLRFFEAVPLRWSAFHLCIPSNPAYSIVKGLMLTVIPKDMRRITRVHSGKLVQSTNDVCRCMYALVSIQGGIRRGGRRSTLIEDCLLATKRPFPH
jgi:hypothetical protein